MAIRSPPRLCWAPDDSGLVSYRNRLVQLHAASGQATRELASERIYDVRFRSDGRIIVLDDRGSLTFKRDGELIEQTHFRIDAFSAPDAASMSDNGERYIAVGQREIFAVELGDTPKRIWTLHAASYGIPLADRRPGLAAVGNPSRVGIEMSPDGRLVAIGYAQSGRAWIVIELESDQFLQRAASGLDTPKHGGRSASPQLFAFDAEGKRLAMAVPDQGTSWNVVRLNSEEREVARAVPGGAVAVAMDGGGNLAAYAYAK
ncbi:MAG TPA: hypothetical protein VGC41_11020, partial [Kofleriaceae bacterium]